MLNENKLNKAAKMTYDIRFKTSFNCIVSGPSGSGKTTWVRNLLKLKEPLFTTTPSKTFLFYSMPQDIYIEMKREGLVDELYNVGEHVPTLEFLTNLVRPYKHQGGSLIIFDDMVTSLSADFERVFLNLSHHENASVILMSQNMFYHDKTYRTLSLNAHYFVIMKNDRDKQQVTILAKQICPSNSKFIVDAYTEATRRPYSYLIIDFRSDTPPSIKLRSHIYPHQLPVRVYLEK